MQKKNLNFFQPLLFSPEYRTEVKRKIQEIEMSLGTINFFIHTKIHSKLKLHHHNLVCTQHIRLISENG